MSSTDVADRPRDRAFPATLAAIFVVAVAVNYLWELAQAPLYVAMEWSGRTLWHCFVASLGDGVLVLLIFAAGWAAVGRRTWFERPGVRGSLAMLAAGLGLGVGVELIAVHVAARWSYTPRMPLVPWLGIGVVPIVQMLVLPPLIFHLAARWHSRPARGPARQSPRDPRREEL